MARIIKRPCTVTMGRLPAKEGEEAPARAELVPISFIYLREKHLVTEILDHWREAGRWWLLEPESETWRVVTTKGGVFELLHYPTTKQFLLYKAYD